MCRNSDKANCFAKLTTHTSLTVFGGPGVRNFAFTIPFVVAFRFLPALAFKMSVICPLGQPNLDLFQFHVPTNVSENPGP